MAQAKIAEIIEEMSRVVVGQEKLINRLLIGLFTGGHILLEGDAQKTAGEIKAKLASGEDFAKLAKEYSTDAGSKEQGGDLGFSS
ncbi:MAG: hypothetical protein EAZ80_05685, partial [Runella slithyformis]